MPEYTHGGDVLTAQARWGGPVLDCSANLNPLGMPPEVREAAERAVGDAERYPDPQCRALRAAIAAHDGVRAEQVLCGGGACELIFRLAFALRPGHALVTAPTFSEYEAALSRVGCAVERFGLDPGRAFDLDGEILDAIVPGLDLVCLCTPNNPTGRRIDPALLLRIAARCRKNGVRLAVDECFLELAEEGGPGLAPYLEDYPNLLLLRAFTKSYAMAGLRLGYVLTADRALLEEMALSGPPWSVSAPAQAAGVAALERCPDWPQRARALLRTERPALAAGLTGVGLAVIPSQANYLLFRAAGETGLRGRLLDQGVLIRCCADYHGLGPDWYRVCVGQAEQNRRLLAALKEVLEWPRRS